MRQLLIISALAFITGCATTVTNPVTGQAERTVMDESREIAEGGKAHAQVLSEYGVYPNQRLQAYVNDLGQRLAAQSHRANLTWHFTVLDSPEINAFALPGGYVYITRGLMAYMDSEADLAGVIGHEIGHVTARHGAQRATRQQTAGLGVLAATVLGVLAESRVPGAGKLVGQVSQGVAAGYIASYGRDQELQADQLGAEYLARNQYNPRNMVDVIQVLKHQEQYAIEVARAEGRKAPPKTNWLSSHPSNDQRLQTINQIATQYTGNYADDGRARYLQMIDGMTFGESSEQGLTRGRNFYHTGLGIALTAPKGWKIRNSPDAVMLLNAAGDAGLLLKLVPSQAGGTHDEIIQNLFKPTQGQAQRYAVSGLPATHFTGLRTDDQGQVQPVETTIVTGPRKQHFALTYAAKTPQAMTAARASLRAAEGSFRALTEADRAAAQPWTVRAVKAPAGGLKALADAAPLNDYAEQQLRLLNGLYDGGELTSGSLVKTIR
jgi:predicted Zn-dependent protease